MEQQGIYVELADPEQVLMILPLLKVRHHFPFAEIRKKIKSAVEKCSKQQRDKVEIDYSHDIEALSTLAVSYKELQTAENEWISYTKATGRILHGNGYSVSPGYSFVCSWGENYY